MLKKWMLGGVALAAMLPAQSHAQEQAPAELVMYGQGRYKGYSYSVAGASQSMRIPFTVKSVQIPEGQAWELCSGNTFSGCKEFTQSDPSMVMNVRSVRPVAARITTDTNGARIEVPAGTGEAMSVAAREFCRVRGWRYSVHARLKTLDGRTFLADVLCSDASN